jgi:uncharacterized protein YdaU (DUF1376 family)
MEQLGVALIPSLYCLPGGAEHFLLPWKEGFVSNWYRREPIKFIDGTMRLSLEEKGAYSLCIDLMHIHGGTIPDDPKWLSGVCGCSVRKWKAIRERLLELGKLDEQNGRLSNFRATLEAENFAKLSRNLAEHGARGGRQRAENNAERNKNNGVDKGEASSRKEKKRKEESAPNGAVRASHIPGGWKPLENDVAYALEKGIAVNDVESVAENFHEHWSNKSGKAGLKINWSTAWQTWVRNEIKFNGRKENTNGISPETQPIGSKERIARAVEILDSRG